MRLVAVERISLGLAADNIRTVEPGESFEAPDAIGAPLVKLGAAEVAPEPPAPPEPVKASKPAKG